MGIPDETEQDARTPPPDPSRRMRVDPAREMRVTVPAGDYILGDPCYSVPDGRWAELLASCGVFATPVGRIDGFDILAFGTEHGDGAYMASNGAILAVDSGLIGLVPADISGAAPFAADACRVRFVRPTVCERQEDGTLTFGDITVRTGDDDEDEDDE